MEKYATHIKDLVARKKEQNEQAQLVERLVNEEKLRKEGGKCSREIKLRA